MSLTPQERIFEMFHVGIKHVDGGGCLPLCVTYCCRVMPSEFGATVFLRTDENGHPYLAMKHAEVLVARNAAQETKLASYTPPIHFCPFCGARVRLTVGLEAVMAELYTAFPQCREPIAEALGRDRKESQASDIDDGTTPITRSSTAPTV